MFSHYYSNVPNILEASRGRFAPEKRIGPECASALTATPTSLRPTGGNAPGIDVFLAAAVAPLGPMRVVMVFGRDVVQVKYTKRVNP
jgi:hypothetical protein